MATHWALINEQDVCVAVHVASEEWIAGWSDPDGKLRYVPTEIGKGYACVDGTLDPDTGWFIPPAYTSPGEGWVFDTDPEVWDWVDMNPSDTPPA